ncbi:hypothetical protein Adeg_0022 [Ammonifex degensii KC4]|uniref:TubC N-terminal docking domain-containing protein n=2 Tax=Ammonifex degensii TaxID=42838 RepID=C9RA90_AMMDK|nr:hypothetical protein Adeg_0022 [Ammonifex degensii KC4]
MISRSEIPGLLELLSRHGVEVYLRDGTVKVRKPWPSWDGAPGPVKDALRQLKAQREELRRHLLFRREFYSWTEPCDPEEEARVLAALGEPEERVPPPEREAVATSGARNACRRCKKCPAVEFGYCAECAAEIREKLDPAALEERGICLGDINF